MDQTRRCDQPESLTFLANGAAVANEISATGANPTIK